MPKNLLPYWTRILERFPKGKLREDDGEFLILLAGALHDSEQGLDQAQQDPPMMNSRRAARKEYLEGLASFRDTLAGRDDDSEGGSKKRRGTAEDYLK